MDLAKAIQLNISRWIRNILLVKGVSLNHFSEICGLGRTKLRALHSDDEISSLAKDLALLIEIGKNSQPKLEGNKVLSLILGEVSEEGRDQNAFGKNVNQSVLGWTVRQKASLLDLLRSGNLEDLIESLDKESMKMLITYRQELLRIIPMLPSIRMWVEDGSFDALNQLIFTKKPLRPYRGKR